MIIGGNKSVTPKKTPRKLPMEMAREKKRLGRHGRAVGKGQKNQRGKKKARDPKGPKLKMTVKARASCGGGRNSAGQKCLPWALEKGNYP